MRFKSSGSVESVGLSLSGFSDRAILRPQGFRVYTLYGFRVHALGF